jgi:hypothetical protein
VKLNHTEGLLVVVTTHTIPTVVDVSTEIVVAACSAGGVTLPRSYDRQVHCLGSNPGSTPVSPGAPTLPLPVVVEVVEVLEVLEVVEVLDVWVGPCVAEVRLDPEVGDVVAPAGAVGVEADEPE